MRTSASVLALLLAAALPTGAETTDSAEARLRDLTPLWEPGPGPILKGFHNLYNACVVRIPDDDAYPFRLFFFGYAAEEHNPGYPGGDAIYLGRARDLHQWGIYAGERGWDATEDPRTYAPIIVGDPKPYDGMANGDPSVVYRDGVYYMALSSVGFDARKDAEGVERLYVVNCVLGATSKDGITWTKTAAPIAVWDQEYERGYEIIDGEIPPAPDDFKGGYHRPSLMYDEGRWKLWFDYYLPGTFLSMGYAECAGRFDDPKAWTVLHAGDAPLLRDWANPSVVRVGDVYVSFADPPGYPPEMGGDGRQMTVATSRDGIAWRVRGHIRPDGLASSHVPQASLLEIDGERWVYVFYAWKPARVEGEPWDFRYKQIRYVRCREADLVRWAEQSE